MLAVVATRIDVEAAAVRERRHLARGWLVQAELGHRPVGRPPVPLPDLAGVTFLETTTAVVEEGLGMHHCVHLFAEDAAEGGVFVFHVEHGGGSATVVVGHDGEVRHGSGPFYGFDPPAAVWGRRVLGEWGATFPEVGPRGGSHLVAMTAVPDEYVAPLSEALDPGDLERLEVELPRLREFAAAADVARMVHDAARELGSPELAANPHLARLCFYAWVGAGRGEG